MEIFWIYRNYDFSTGSSNQSILIGMSEIYFLSKPNISNNIIQEGLLYMNTQYDK